MARVSRASAACLAAALGIALPVLAADHSGGNLPAAIDWGDTINGAGLSNTTWNSDTTINGAGGTVTIVQGTLHDQSTLSPANLTSASVGELVNSAGADIVIENLSATSSRGRSVTTNITVVNRGTFTIRRASGAGDFRYFRLQGANTRLLNDSTGTIRSETDATSANNIIDGNGMFSNDGGAIVVEGPADLLIHPTGDGAYGANQSVGGTFQLDGGDLFLGNRWSLVTGTTASTGTLFLGGSVAPFRVPSGGTTWNVSGSNRIYTAGADEGIQTLAGAEFVNEGILVSGTTNNFAQTEKLIGGTGVFRNKGTVRVMKYGCCQANRDTLIDDSATIVNEGTWELWTQDGNVELLELNNVTFSNLAAGTVKAIGGSYLPLADNSAATPGRFVNAGGSIVAVTNMEIRPTGPNSSTGATYTLTGNLHLGGQWTEISGTKTGDGMVVLARRTATTINPLTVAPGGTVFNVDGTNRWDTSPNTTESIQTVAGSEFLNLGILVAGTTNNFAATEKILGGNGVFRNQDTVIIRKYATGQANRDMIVDDSAVIVNEGVWELQTLNGNVEFFEILTTNNIFSNLSSGTVRATLGDPLAMAGEGVFVNAGGTLEAVTNMTLRPTGPNLSTGGVYNLTGDLYLGGQWSEFSGTNSGPGAVVLGRRVGAGMWAITTAPGGTLFEVNGTNRLDASTVGTPPLLTVGGTEFTNRSILVAGTTNNFIQSEHLLGGSGTFRNEGTVIVSKYGAGQANRDMKVVGTVTIANDGDWQLRTSLNGNNVEFFEFDPGQLFSNGVDGTLRATLGTGNGLPMGDSQGGASGELVNLGTVAADGGVMMVDATMGDAQWYDGSNTLLAGTWKADASRLDLDGRDFAIIAEAAKVVLVDSNAVLPEVAALTNVYGTFGAHSTTVFSTVTNLTVDGALEFGLADSDTNDTLVVTGVEVNGDVDFTGGRVDVVDRGLTDALQVGDVFTLVTWTGADVGGKMTLGAVPDNGLNYALVTWPDKLQLVISPPNGTVLIVR